MKRYIIIWTIGLLLTSVLIPMSSSTQNEKPTSMMNENSTDSLMRPSIALSSSDFPVMTEKPVMTEEFFKMDEYDPDPQPTRSLQSVPSQFSWLDYNGDWTTPARDQGNCGSCYIFGPIGAFEGAINLASGYPDTDIDLSEQYCLSCINNGCYGCNGGLGNLIFEAIYDTAPGQSGNGINGVPIESCMPYQANDNIPCSDKCDDWDYFTEPPAADNKLWQIDEWSWTSSFSEDNPSDWHTMKTWLLDYGPLCIDIYVGGFSSFGSSHHSSTDVYEQDDNGITNHEITLVGWVDDDSILNGGYWIIKNSWGAGWGYNGFANIAYGCNSLAEDICCWVKAKQWPASEAGPGPVDVDLAVFADFDFETNEGTRFPHLGEEIEFVDTSDGDVAERSWDFDGDGIIDSTKKNPSWTYEAEGEYEVTLEIVGEWGLNSTRTKTVEVREVWPPLAVVNPEEYVGNDLMVSFDARFSEDRDGGQIVSYTWDFDDGETGSGGYITHEFAQPDTIYEVSLTVTDDDGASETATSIVKIDQTVPPETTINHGFGCEDDLEWYGSTQRIFFEATDWSSVIDTFYRIDGGEWKKYVASEQQFIPVGGEGMHTVEAYSVDYYGNEESPVSESFGIDSISPTVSITVEGESSAGWYDGSVMISLSGEDDRSGFDMCLYKLDSGPWVEYSDSFSVSEGQHVINVVGVDEAGNTVEEQQLVNVDGGPPVSHVIFNGPGSNNLFFGSVELRLAASDPGAGVEKIMYRLDSGNLKEYKGSFVVDELGDHVVECYAVDLLGNQESSKQVNFKVSPVNFIVDVDQPRDALYLFGIELFPMNNPTIIGPVDVMVDLQSFTSDPAMVEYVEFFIDGSSEMIDSEHPYGWRLDQQLFGSHTLTVNVYSTNGEIVSEEKELTCFII